MKNCGGGDGDGAADAAIVGGSIVGPAPGPEPDGASSSEECAIVCAPGRARQRVLLALHCSECYDSSPDVYCLRDVQRVRQRR